jgi:hypothetical protein
MLREKFVQLRRKGFAVQHLQVQSEKAMEIKVADVAELVDARDLKSHLPAEIPRELCQTPPKITTQDDRTKRDLSNIPQVEHILPRRSRL